MTDRSFYITVRNHTEGMEVFSFLKEHKLDVRISPTPRSITTQCGMSILVNPSSIEQVRELALTHSLKIEDIVELENQINPNRDKYC